MMEESQIESSSFALGEIAVISDRGLNPKRELNEDSYLILEDHGLFAVADGVGGQNAGETASRMTMEILRRHLPSRTKADRVRVLEQMIRYANRTLYETSLTEKQCSGMATTLALVWLDRKAAIIGHVGDSRVYRFAGGQLHRETVDHTLAEERSSNSTLETALPRNVITRAVGVEPDVQPDFKRVPVEPETTFLLCTDGITRHVTDEEIWQLLAQEKDPMRACQELKERCYERGAKDNLTALVVRVDAELGDRRTPRRRDETGASGRSTDSDRRITVALSSGGNDDAPPPPISSETDSESSSWAAHVEPVGMPPRKKLSLSGGALLAAIGTIVLSLSTGIYLEHEWHFVQSVNESSESSDPANGLFNSGRQHYEAGRLAEAERDFQQATSLAPSRGTYMHWLGKTEWMLKRYTDAARCFEDAAVRDGSPDNYLFAAAAYRALGDRDRAERALDEFRRMAEATGR